MIKFNELLEKVQKHNKIKWNRYLMPNYNITYNDNPRHNLLDRVMERTNLSPNKIKEKVEKAILYVIKKDKNNFFKRKTMIAFNMTKSKFKIMILFNPFEEPKYLRVSSILADDMTVKGAIKWNLNENININEFIEFHIEIQE